MSKEHPATHIQGIAGTADLPSSDGYKSAAIGVDSSFNLVFRAKGATRRAIDDFSDQTIAGAKTLTGTVVMSGSVTLSGTTAFTGATTGVRSAVSVTLADTIAPLAADSGTTYICTKTTSTQIFTLPAAATAGLTFTVVCGAGAAGGEIQVGVATGDNIIGKTHAANDGTGLVSTVTTGLLKNTAATNVVGDFCRLVSDGITTWYMVAEAGVWSVT